MKKLSWLVVIGALVVMTGPAAQATTPSETCAAKKIGAAARKARRKVKCYQSATRAEVSVDSTCLQAAEDQFAAEFAAAELSGGCAHTGDAATVESLVDAFVDDVVAAESPRIFVTSTESTGNLGGLAGANTTCSTRAAAASLGGTYKAWLSKGATDVSQRLVHSGLPYYLVDGTSRVADDWSDLTDGGLQHAIDQTESGVTIAAEVWTDSKADATHEGHDCVGWTSGLSSDYGTVGVSDATNSRWTNAYIQFCDRTNVRLYCVQQ